MISDLSTLTKNHHAMRLLTKMQNAGYESSVLAGGAIRDMYNGKFVSDYDIFLWCPYSSAENTKDPTLESLAQLIGISANSNSTSLFYDPRYTISKYKPTKKDDYTINSHISTVWNVIHDYKKYQLIFVRHRPVDYINMYFDLGICKAYCDGTKIHLSEDFMSDIANQTITICGQEMTKRMFNYVVSHHLPRVKKKYPGFRVIVADYNKEHIDATNAKLI